MVIQEVLRSISASVGDPDDCDVSAVTGGSINRSYRIASASGAIFFLKLNEVWAGDMFEAERAGLTELRAADSVRVPKTLDCGVAGGHAFLLMEYLDIGSKTSAAAGRLGSMLARQHRQTNSAFGWSRDNTIGSTPQINGWEEDWITFFRYKRLGYQLDLAATNGAGEVLQDGGRLLIQKMPEFFDGYVPAPALLHGDLWGGNWGVTTDGEPVIFDPAVYYGDREADIAMSRLFGGFGPEFYAAYNKAWQLDPGFESRIDLYNLYHVLNHFNLFGGSYFQQASDLIDRLLAQ